jgi:large subunit ribosomal protein L10
MAVSKDKKKEVLEGLQGAVSSSKSMVFVNFKGLNVFDTTALRRKLNDDGITYTVAKKTLTKKALSEGNLKGEMPALEGELAVAYGDDLIAPAREVYEFQKKFPEKLTIIGGVFDGEYKTQEEMTAIASIPPLQTLRGMFVNIINSPVQRFAIALNQIAEKRG